MMLQVLVRMNMDNALVFVPVDMHKIMRLKKRLVG